MSAKILAWREMRRGHLIGFVRAEFSSGLILNDITILNGEKGPWASPPSRPMVGRDGAALKDNGGKLRNQHLVEFKTKEIRDKWSAAVIEALRSAHPEAFE